MAALTLRWAPMWAAAHWDCWALLPFCRALWRGLAPKTPAGPRPRCQWWALQPDKLLWRSSVFYRTVCGCVHAETLGACSIAIGRMLPAEYASG